jgi:hypothetical protein
MRNSSHNFYSVTSLMIGKNLKIYEAPGCEILSGVILPIFLTMLFLETPLVHVLTLVLKIQCHVYKSCTAVVYRSVLGLYFL